MEDKLLNPSIEYIVFITDTHHLHILLEKSY